MIKYLKLEFIMNYRSVNEPYIILWINEEKNSSIILLCRTLLVEYYLEIGLIILQQNSNNLSSLPNQAKQRIHVNNIHK